MFDEHEHEYRQHDDGPELPADLTALEGQLARLSPTAPRIDRDRLMFDAGRASVEGITQGATGYAGAVFALDVDPNVKNTLAQPVAHHRSLRFWRLATATMTAATVLLATLLVRQSQQAGHFESIAKPTPSIPSPSPNEVHLVTASPGISWPFESSQAMFSTSDNYLSVRQLVLTQGLSALDRDARSGVQNGAPSTADKESPSAEQELLKEYLSEEAALQYRI